MIVMGEITALWVNSFKTQDSKETLNMSIQKYYDLKGKNHGEKCEFNVILDQKIFRGQEKNATIYKNVYALESREERATLLKAGFKGKEIESLYLHLNDITIIGINWGN
jgi:hypothetical protein